MLKRFITGTLALCLCLLLVAPASAAKKLVLVSPHQESIQREFADAFKEWYKKKTGETVEFEWLDQGGTSSIMRFIRSEFSKNPNGINIDIFWGGGHEPYMALDQEKRLEVYKLPDAILSKVPKDFFGIPVYDPKYTWYGTALSGFGIIYNKVVLKAEKKPEPQTWEDLTKPELKGWVGSADPRQSGSVHMSYAAMIEAYGWEKAWSIITKLGANVKNFTQSAGDTPRDVVAGEVGAGLAIDFYAWPRVEEFGADKVGYVLPKGLTVVNPDSMGILKGAPNLDVAKEFVNFVMSENGQKLWMLPKGAEGGPQKFTLGRLSVLPSLYKTLGKKSIVPLNPFEMGSLGKYDSDRQGKLWSLVNDLVGALLIDTHQDLVKAWEAVIAGGMKPAAVAEMTKMPVTLEEAMTLSAKWKDDAFRNQKINEWVKFAQEKYKKAAELGKKA
ncbi:MAG: extracellular solute-binding protein [Candidatus Tectomicrobia bacterium]|nr:extracellular solute-binding protein [Candidatus Tectomicrobia bacterium]